MQATILHRGDERGVGVNEYPCGECGQIVGREFHNYACCVKYRLDNELPLKPEHRRYLMWLGEQHLDDAAKPQRETSDLLL